jgi:hypothetical protein
VNYVYVILNAIDRFATVEYHHYSKDNNCIVLRCRVTDGEDNVELTFRLKSQALMMEWLNVNFMLRIKMF